MDKLKEVLKEIKNEGTLQEQGRELVELEKLYKKLILETGSEVYKNKLDKIRYKMCILNDRVRETLEVFDELMEMKSMDVKTFLDTFNIKEEEYNKDENCYNNLLKSNTDLGHCLRMTIIWMERKLKEAII